MRISRYLCAVGMLAMAATVSAAPPTIDEVVKNMNAFIPNEEIPVLPTYDWQWYPKIIQYTPHEDAL